jgi:hypothetical protein
MPEKPADIPARPTRTVDEVLNYLNSKLDVLLKYPRAWATNHESLELQALQLFTAIAYIRRPDMDERDFGLARATFIEIRFGDKDHASTTMLSSLIDDDDDRFTKLTATLNDQREFLDNYYASVDFKTTGIKEDQ